MLRLDKIPRHEFMFFHQGVLGVPMASGFELPDEVLRATSLPKQSLCFTGHYHRHQKVSDNLIIVGSPMQHTWGDSGDERGYIILDTDTKKWEFKAYAGPRFINKEVFVDGCGNTSDINGNYIRLFGDVPLIRLEEMRDFVKDHGAISCEIVPKTKTAPDFQTQQTFSIEDAIKIYEKEALLTNKEIEIGKQLRTGKYGIKRTLH